MSNFRENVESWKQLLNFVEDFPDDDQWHSWKINVKRILSALKADGLSKCFRLGQSMHHIIFSTADRHGLELIDPLPLRVTLAVDEQDRLYVALSDRNLWFFEPTRKTVLDHDGEAETIKRYLAYLWFCTRPNDAMPEALVGPWTRVGDDFGLTGAGKESGEAAPPNSRPLTGTDCGEQEAGSQPAPPGASGAKR